MVFFIAFYIVEIKRKKQPFALVSLEKHLIYDEIYCCMPKDMYVFVRSVEFVVFSSLIDF